MLLTEFVESAFETKHAPGAKVVATAGVRVVVHQRLLFGHQPPLVEVGVVQVSVVG